MRHDPRVLIELQAIADHVQGQQDAEQGERVRR